MVCTIKCYFILWSTEEAVLLLPENSRIDNKGQLETCIKDGFHILLCSCGFNW